MPSEEVAEFLPLVQRLRARQAEKLGIDHVYYFYNEDTKHHFHLWMVPRYPWMPQFGKSIAAIRPTLLHARDIMNSAELQQEVADAAAKLRLAMNA